MTKIINSQLHELLKAYLSSGNNCPRDLTSDLHSIVTVFNENLKDIEKASFV